jgi:hypothetical protein
VRFKEKGIQSAKRKWAGYRRGNITLATFAERWAEAIEAELKPSITVDAVASRAFGAVDDSGLTLEQMLKAIYWLGECWHYGPSLLRWANKVINGR